MKSLFTFFAFCLIAVTAAAQKTDTALFKGATKVIIKNKATEAQNFTSSGKALLKAGYLIGKKDEQFGQFISEPVKVDFGVEVFYILASEGEIVISSKFKSSNSFRWTDWLIHQNELEPIVYNKRKPDDATLFMNAVKLAKMISTDQLIYSE